MLGPFEVRTDDGVLVDVPGARLRGLLIALALEPGRVVPKARLVDWIWGGCLIMALGGFVALTDRRYRRAAERSADKVVMAGKAAV